tara:strand:+ start:148 stop:789 length:642 start_codon:yes stop_codon:yes gene_type:complete
MPEWKLSENLVDYLVAEESMTNRVNKIISHQQSELIWMLQHKSVFTLGASSKKNDLLLPSDIPVYQTRRGGQMTYHGPGQRVIYLLIDLRKKEKDIKKFVWLLEEWIIEVLKELDITGFRLKGLVGIWVEDKRNQNIDGSFHHKIASIGLKIRKWVTYHGLSLNIDPDLEPFKRIVPCGIKDKGVTSIQKLRGNSSIDKIDGLFKEKYSRIFN